MVSLVLSENFWPAAFAEICASLYAVELLFVVVEIPPIKAAI